MSEASRLAVEVEDLSRELRGAAEEKNEVTGAPIPFPKALPAKYTEAEVLRNFQQAFAQAGVKAESISIECSEYPCIACADIALTPSEGHFVNDMPQVAGNAAKVQDAPALATYKDGGENSWLSGRAGDKEGGVQGQRQSANTSM